MSDVSEADQLEAAGRTAQELRELRIETLALGADTRARQALSIASDTRRDAYTVADHEEWEAEEKAERQRRERWVRRLIVLTTAVVAFAVVGAIIAFLLADRARLETQVQLDQYRQSALTACNARNAALAQQQLVYEDLRRIEGLPNNAQDPGFVDEKVRAYDRALASLPDPVDCSVWESR